MLRAVSVIPGDRAYARRYLEPALSRPWGPQHQDLTPLTADQALALIVAEPLVEALPGRPDQSGQLRLGQAHRRLCPAPG